MSRAFTKLFRSILDSTVWQEPDHVRLTWIAMLAMADLDGFVASSIPGLAARARVTLEQAEKALDVFLAPDKYSRTPDYEGRRIAAVKGGWILLNHETYRKAIDAEVEKERKRDWAREQRSKVKADVVPFGLQNATSSGSSEVASASSSLSPSESRSDPDPDHAAYPSAEVAPPSVPALTRVSSPEAAQGQRQVWHSLDGWEPTEGLYAEALMAGLSRERFEARVAELRGGPIGGKRGTFDRTDYVRRLLGKWRTWDENDRAGSKRTGSAQQDHGLTGFEGFKGVRA